MRSSYSIGPFVPSEVGYPPFGNVILDREYFPVGDSDPVVKRHARRDLAGCTANSRAGVAPDARDKTGRKDRARVSDWYRWRYAGGLEKRGLKDTKLRISSRFFSHLTRSKNTL
ncbi:hypothetical protein SAMD00023353_0200100 [Rosellinia necatrix]|uniref:Uncharacterized protein n=1 Tax=Rosellinia necatrix TaxID=77044 RepID=A0A1S7UK16_ROSNE|nr:hypothetical protein SAMD00023353_0200100 [Rosellinia necatrix]